jgi:hypothetical protein
MIRCPPALCAILLCGKLLYFDHIAPEKLVGGNSRIKEVLLIEAKGKLKLPKQLMKECNQKIGYSN